MARNFAFTRDNSRLVILICENLRLILVVQLCPRFSLRVLCGEVLVLTLSVVDFAKAS